MGLVQLDSYLSGYTDVWSDYDELFGVAVQGWVSSTSKMNLTVVDNTHFITEIYRNGTQMNALFGQEVDSQESDLVFENVTVDGSANTLVVMPYNDSNSPALVIKSHGNGRTVLSTFSTGRVDLGIFAGIDGFGERPLRTNSGVHGLLWRSMVWAARKPFAFMGMPPFLTSTIYGVGGSARLDYIDKLVEHGFFVHLNIFADDVYRRGSAYWNRLKNYYWNGTVHVAPNSWNDNWLIYWNLTGNKEYDLSTLSKYFSWLDGNQTAWNITFSAWRIPNFCAVGENAVPYLLDREWDLIGCIKNIPFSEGTLSG
ncbi:hypothetical protein KAU92_06310, partial [Candidatus Bathyarchaeota archaeon]|nr:hypothetical protein [Candidatus Bathyarchaeota archaeon]